MTILEAFCTISDGLETQREIPQSDISLNVSKIHERQENDEKTAKKRPREGETDFTAEIPCQDSIIHPLVRTEADTILA